MAFSVSGTYAIIGISVLLALGTFVVAVGNAGERLAGAQEAANRDWTETTSTNVTVESVSYDGTQLTVRVNNTGTRQLAVDRTELLVDGQYFGTQSWASHSVAGVSGTEVWAPGETLEITLSVSTPNRIKVVTEHGVAVLEVVFPFVRDDAVAYTLNDEIRSATTSSLTTSYGRTAQAAGPVVHNFGTGESLEVPAVDSSNQLFTVTGSGTTDTLATGVKAGSSRLTAGRWQGSDPSIFYVDSSTENIERVTATGSTTEVATTDADGVAGIADVDGDDAAELVFGGDGGNSDEVSYVDDDGTVERTGQSYGSNSGNIGLGEPADFDGDGTARVPIVDGSNDILLTDSGGTTTKIFDGGTAVKAPIGTSDVDDDGQPEIVFVSSNTNANGDNSLRFVDDVTGTNTVTDLTGGTGSTLGADTDAGVV